MRPFKCFCPTCISAHELPLEMAEFKMLINLVAEPLNSDGRLSISCNDCVPFKFSKTGEQ